MEKDFDVHFSINSHCANCGVWARRVVVLHPEKGHGFLLCLECAVSLRTALGPAWKEHHKEEARKRPEVLDRFRELFESHNAAVRMRDMSNEDFLGVLEVFVNELPLVSVQSRIVAEAIRRLGGEDEWVDESEEATERR